MTWCTSWAVCEADISENSFGNTAISRESGRSSMGIRYRYHGLSAPRNTGFYDTTAFWKGIGSISGN